MNNILKYYRWVAYGTLIELSIELEINFEPYTVIEQYFQGLFQNINTKKYILSKKS